MIGIIDYRMGNLRSVQKAFEHVGAAARVVASPDELADAQRLVLPGVGAFADGMTYLRDAGWIEPIRQWIASDRPFLGICLGMQLLFDGSQEDAPTAAQPVPGLGVLRGQVVRFSEQVGERRIKGPHMGWNTLRPTRPNNPLYAGLDTDPAVYFVHSYYVQPDEATASDVVVTVTDYGQAFCSSVWRDRLWATQFHPEKSQRVGLRMLANFAGA